jgi:hypothetical protein
MTIAKTEQLSCNVKGAAEIKTVNEGGVGAPLSDYVYNWYNNQNNLIATTTSTAKADLEAGTYFIKAVNLSTTCQSDAFEFKIEDKIHYQIYLYLV